jgi:ATP-binding cassette, subfamily F, member 3
MLIAQFSEVSKSFGSHDVLDKISWQIPEGARVALVGRNGSGKTTLFRMLAAEMEPDRGTVWRRRGAIVAAMEQEVQVEDRRTLREEAARGLKHLEELHREYDEVTSRLGTLTEHDPEGKDLLDHYGHLQDRLEREGGYTFEARVRSVLEGLHFTERDLDRPLAEFSGGQKSRAILARVLLRDPDLLLLDEPTNHLDLTAIEWLEDFLLNYRGAFVLVSHDRMFVNRLARDVMEIRNRHLHAFRGNYDDFLKERERRLEEQARKFELQQEEIERQKDFIRRNIAGQKSRQALSRRKMLERMELLEAPEWPASSIHMQLPEPERSARIVLEARNLGKSFGTTPIFTGVTFQLQRGQKLGLIGPNGIGKTTLVRVLMGEEALSEGTLRVGPGVRMGYVEQEQKRLVGARSVLEEVWSVTPDATENAVRTFLGGFLFRGDDVFKPLSVLSGGEKSRVALAKLVREGANLLVLDEPTNHLDIESREVIEAALRAFGGTVLVVSHDRYFLDRTVDHILELQRAGCRLWPGNYSTYAALRARESGTGPVTVSPKKEAAPPPKPKTASEDKALDRAREKRLQREHEKRRRRVQEAESVIARLESKREDLILAMMDPTAGSDAARLGGLQAELDAIDAQIVSAILEWERLSLEAQGSPEDRN